MGQPSTLYAWDTSDTNVVPPTSGHQLNGYVNAEVPAASEWNGLFANWSLWLAYVQAALNPGTRWRDCIPSGTLSNMTGPTPVTVSGSPWSSHGIRISPRVGEVLSTIRLNEYYGASVASSGTLKLQRQNLDGTFTTLATLSFNGDGGLGFAGHQLLTQAITGGNTSSGTQETVTDGCAYYLAIDGTGSGGGSLSVSSVGYQVVNAF